MYSFVHTLDRYFRADLFRCFCILSLCFFALGGCQQRGGTDDPVVGAVRYNDMSKLSSFLLQGGDPNLRSKDQDHLLYIASGPLGGVEVARALIRAGADIDAKSRNGRTAFQNAVGWCDLGMIKLLVEAGADTKMPKSEQDALKVVCSGPNGERKSTLRIIREFAG